MKNRGFKEVYQIDGGIVTYGKEYGDNGLWEGALYTFDNRMSIEFSKDFKSIANCEKCGTKAYRFYNCAEKMNDEICTHPQRKYSKAELIG
jgi:UPF0176 protein